jgi:hypothetical protein
VTQRSRAPGAATAAIRPCTHTPSRATAHAIARHRATARAITRQCTRHRPHRHRATTHPRARAAEEQKSYEEFAVRHVAACAPKPRFPLRRHSATARPAASSRCSASRSGSNLSRGREAGNSRRCPQGVAPRRFSVLFFPPLLGPRTTRTTFLLSSDPGPLGLPTRTSFGGPLWSRVSPKAQAGAQFRSCIVPIDREGKWWDLQSMTRSRGNKGR